MLDVGFVGWRGIVGSVLQQRFLEENDFAYFNAHFFSTSNVSGSAPDGSVLLDAYDVSVLRKFPIIVSAQGNAYTKRVFGKLRESGWDGFWVDAASTLRSDSGSQIVLDPVNRVLVDRALVGGVKNFVGANCTVSGMLMGFGGLFASGLVDGVSVATYQAASGGGARHMRELLAQFGVLFAAGGELLDSGGSILDLAYRVWLAQCDGSLDVSEFGVPLAGNLIPWIDSDLGNGVSREEYKGDVELNRILGGVVGSIPVDSICVRVGVLRCHSQAVTFRLRDSVSLSEVEDMVVLGNPWVRLVPNNREDTVLGLSPVAVSGALDVAVGRLRKSALGDNFVSGFTVADQLLWGAAEPLRRMLLILLGEL